MFFGSCNVFFWSITDVVSTTRVSFMRTSQHFSTVSLTIAISDELNLLRTYCVTSSLSSGLPIPIRALFIKSHFREAIADLTPLWPLYLNKKDTSRRYQTTDRTSFRIIMITVILFEAFFKNTILLGILKERSWFFTPRSPHISALEITWAQSQMNNNKSQSENSLHIIHIYSFLTHRDTTVYLFRTDQSLTGKGLQKVLPCTSTTFNTKFSQWPVKVIMCKNNISWVHTELGGWKSNQGLKKLTVNMAVKKVENH